MKITNYEIRIEPINSLNNYTVTNHGAPTPNVDFSGPVKGRIVVDLEFSSIEAASVRIESLQTLLKKATS